jgi:hypothetical protein
MQGNSGRALVEKKKATVVVAVAIVEPLGELLSLRPSRRVL